MAATPISPAALDAFARRVLAEINRPLRPAETTLVVWMPPAQALALGLTLTPPEAKDWPEVQLHIAAAPHRRPATTTGATSDGE